VELYLVQDPDSAWPPTEDKKDYDRDLLKAYKNSIPVSDITDFIGRCRQEVKEAGGDLIDLLVIGSHGWGGEIGQPGSGGFYIGQNRIALMFPENIERLRVLSPLFRKTAHVYIMACRTGNDDKLLREVSSVLGGVAVHGYTGYITTSGFWLSATVDYRVGDPYETEFPLKEQVGEAKHIVCWSNGCRNLPASAWSPTTEGLGIAAAARFFHTKVAR
jgi:hypothetical protein